MFTYRGVTITVDEQCIFRAPDHGLESDNFDQLRGRLDTKLDWLPTKGLGILHRQLIEVQLLRPDSRDHPTRIWCEYADTDRLRYEWFSARLLYADTLENRSNIALYLQTTEALDAQLKAADAAFNNLVSLATLPSYNQKANLEVALDDTVKV